MARILDRASVVLIPAGMRRGWVLMVVVSACEPSQVGVDSAVPDASLTNADSATDGPGGPSCTLCPMPGPVMNRNAVPSQLVEASGIVASRAHPGILYSHNDSGDVARVIAFDDQGTFVARLNITGATNRDWEDIAIGPCPTGSCIYVGDIGDNSQNRPTKTVYRFPEPNLAPGQPVALPIDITGVETFTFSYPLGLDYFHNAETLLVHPISGAVYVVTKEDPGIPSMVYKFPMPLVPGSTATLIKVATLPFPTGSDPDISGGDIDPCGASALLLMGGLRAYVLVPTAGSAFDTAFTSPGPLAQIRTVPVAPELNGEAISWNATGNGYFMVSEGMNQVLHYSACP